MTKLMIRIRTTLKRTKTTPTATVTTREQSTTGNTYVHRHKIEQHTWPKVTEVAVALSCCVCSLSVSMSCAHVRTSAYAKTNRDKHAYVYANICIHAYLYPYLHVYLSMYEYKIYLHTTHTHPYCKYAYVQHLYTCTHTCIHKHIHTGADSYNAQGILSRIALESLGLHVLHVLFMLEASTVSSRMAARLTEALSGHQHHRSCSPAAVLHAASTTLLDCLPLAYHLRRLTQEVATCSDAQCHHPHWRSTISLVVLCVSLYPSMHLSVYLSPICHLFIYLSESIYPSIYPSVICPLSV